MKHNTKPNEPSQEELNKQLQQILDDDPTPNTFDLTLLEDDENPTHNLNQGLHKKRWYYGKIITNQKHKSEIIILSNKKILRNETTKIRGETQGTNHIQQHGIDYNTNLETPKKSWSNKSIKSWMTQDKDYKMFASLKKDYVLNKIIQKIEHYMDLIDTTQSKIVACYILGTYCFELFETYPILFLHAFRASGKSKLKKIIRELSFHGVEASNISEAGLFRSIEGTKCTLCIDEYEKIDTDRKKLTDQLLNGGIEKGASVKRMIKKGEDWINHDFDVYSPKVICNISGINPTTLSRCILIKLHPTLDPTKGGRKPKVNNPEWQEITNYAHMWIMQHYKQIIDTYDNHAFEGITSRNEDLWRPILSIAKTADPTICEDILEYAKKYLTEFKIDVTQDDLVYKLLRTCANRTTHTKEWYKVKTIREWCITEIDLDRPMSNHKIGKELSKMIFERRLNPNSEYLLSVNLIKQQMERLGYPTSEIACQEDPAVEEENVNCVLYWVTKLSESGAVSFEELVEKSGYNPKVLKEKLDLLKGRGDVLEPRSGLWRSIQ